MKRLKTLSIAMLAALSLAACSKEDSQNDQTGNPGDIYIKLNEGAMGSSKAVTDPFTDGVSTTFSNGGLFFTDDAGNILNPFIIGNNSSASIKPSELKAGYIFTGINDKATRVVVVGNQEFTATASFSTIAKLLEDYDITLEDQVKDPATGNVNEDLSIDHATMWGEGPITVHAVTVAEPWEREADVELRPVIARVELGTLTATKYVDNNTEGIDSDYKVDAIFLNNYYWETGLNGNAADAIADLTNWKRAWEKYFPTSFSGTILGSTPPQAYDGQYDDAYEKIIFDMSDVTASNHVAQAAAGKVWAYNAFATGQATPHIIIKLSDIKQNGTLRPNAVTGIPGTGYITINRYLDLSNPGASYPIASGMVYSIDDLEFSYSDIKDTPEPGGDFSVKVTVNVVPWKVLKVAGGIDKGQ